jgi:hypothetical protein
VENLGECWFYHTMDLPGHGTVEGAWDLRAGVDEYLGGVDFRGKRALDVGTASGFLCFEMERRGAEVVAYDLSDEYDWDSVPYARHDHESGVLERRAHIRQLNNSFWLSHRGFHSAARVAYGTVYEFPEAIGPVDVAAFGCLLLHLRDPFLALARVLRQVRETAIVVEFLGERAPPLSPRSSVPLWQKVLRRLGLVTPPSSAPVEPGMVFLPDPQECMPKETWWRLTPETVCRFLGVLGFRDVQVTYHVQKFQGRPTWLFTVVGRRTDGSAFPSLGV